MILRSVSLTNWRQHAASVATFRPGLTGIIGSNGSGKSTIIESVAWAFFGGAAVRGTMATVKWHGAPKTQKAKVVVKFEVGERGYLLTRTEDSAKLEEAEFGEGEDGYTIVGETIAATPKEVSAYMARMLGLDLGEFLATYLSAQKDLLRLQALGPEDRRRFMLKVLGADRMEKAVKAARESANALKDAALKARAEVGQREPLGQEVAQATVATARAREAWEMGRVLAEEYAAKFRDAWAALQRSTEQKERHDRLTREIEQARRDADAAAREAENIRVEIVECEAAAKRAGEAALVLAELPALREEAARLQQARANLNLVEELRASLRAAEQEQRDAVAQMAAYDAEAHREVEQALAEAEKALAEKQEQRTHYRADLQAQIAAALEQHKVLRERVEVLEGAEDATCPICRRSLGDSLAQVVAGMKEELLEIGRRGAALRETLATAVPSDAENGLREHVHDLATERAKLEVLKADAERATASLPALQQKIDDSAERLCSYGEVSYDAGKADALASRIAHLERLDREAAEDRVRGARVERLKNAEYEATLRREHCERAEALAGQTLVVDLAFNPERHALLEQQATEAREAQSEARAALARAEQALESARERQQRAEAALEKHDRDGEAVAALEQEHRNEARAAAVLASLKTGFVQTIRPELESLVSGFVATLTDGRYESASIDADFGVKLYRGGVAVDVASGGEEDVVAIALRLATSLMIADRSGHALQCVILDEPFGSLDAVRRRNVLDLLTHRLKGLFEQVIVISHFEDVEQAVEHAVVVEYDEARSTSSVRALSLAEAA